MKRFTSTQKALSQRQGSTISGGTPDTIRGSLWYEDTVSLRNAGRQVEAQEEDQRIDFILDRLGPTM